MHERSNTLRNLVKIIALVSIGTDGNVNMPNKKKYDMLKFTFKLKCSDNLLTPMSSKMFMYFYLQSKINESF